MGNTWTRGCQKAFIEETEYKKRLVFAKRHVNWSRKQWRRVMFSDESKFELFGTNKRIFVRRCIGERFKKECLVPTMNHGGGSIMVWGGICAKGTADLKRIKDIMDQKMYHGILVHQVVKEGLKMIGNCFVFQEDNDPKHASKLCRTYLTSKEKQGIIISVKFAFVSVIINQNIFY